MNKYEIAVLFDPGLEVDLSKGEDRFKKIIKENGGKIVSSDNWGKKKLAYTIKKHDSAIYVFYLVEIAPDKVKNIETTLNITNEIIRFLISRPDFKAIAKAEAERKIKDEKNKLNKDSEETNQEGKV
jgi:small subunit ribosomal protein S6